MKNKDQPKITKKQEKFLDECIELIKEKPKKWNINEINKQGNIQFFVSWQEYENYQDFVIETIKNLWLDRKQTTDKICFQVKFKEALLKELRLEK